MANYWIKLYNEILDDPKMATLQDTLWRRVIELFLFAGKLYQDGFLPETKQIAWGLRMNENELEVELQQIVATGIIEKTDNGWFIPKFKQRQEPMSGKERTSNFLKKKQEQQYNGIKTELKRNVTQITDNRLQITDNRTDTENGDSLSLVSAIGILGDTFSGKTGIMMYRNDEWVGALQNMFHANVTPDILASVIDEMKNPPKGKTLLNISGPWSCEKMAIGSVSGNGRKYGI